MSSDPSWSGGYDSNDHQEVTDDDAITLADALELAMPDVPSHDALEHKRVDLDLGIQGVPDDEAVNLSEAFSGPVSQLKLLAFIAFCRKEGFMIE